MKKGFAVFIILTLLVFLPACSTHASKSATYQVDTGDKIKVTVDIKAGYDLKMEVPFTISKDETDILFGTFDFLETYDTYYQLVKDDPNAAILAEDSKDGNEYFFYTVNNLESQTSEYDYFVKINNSQTVVIIGSMASREEAEAAFAAITLSLADSE